MDRNLVPDVQKSVPRNVPERQPAARGRPVPRGRPFLDFVADARTDVPRLSDVEGALNVHEGEGEEGKRERLAPMGRDPQGKTVRTGGRGGEADPRHS